MTRRRTRKPPQGQAKAPPPTEHDRSHRLNPMGEFYARCAAARTAHDPQRWRSRSGPPQTIGETIEYLEELNEVMAAELVERRAREFGPPRLLP